MVSGTDADGRHAWSARAVASPTHVGLRGLARRTSPLRRPPTLVFTVYLCGLLLALTVIPPWQNPDEPHHMAGILEPARPYTPDRGLRVEREIIRSMAAHEWWRYYDRVTPRPLPEQFSDIDSLSNRPRFAGRVYYEGMALLVRGLAPTAVVGRLYFVRCVSALLGLLTLYCCWAAARCCLTDWSAIIPTAVLAMNPQFVIVSTTASPDAVVNLCGAFMWWQACRLLREPHLGTPMLRTWGAAAFGAMTRRIGLLLLPMAAMVTLMAVAAAFRRSTRDGVSFAIGGLVGVAGIVAFALLLPDQILTVATGSVVAMISAPFVHRLTLSFLGDFTLTLLDSGWLNGGWMRLPAPRFWLNVMHALTALAAAGVLRALWRGGPGRRVLFTALSMVAVPVAAIYAFYFTLMVGPTARYLFPVGGALSVLFWMGLRGWWPVHHWGIVATVLLTTMAAFDLVAWTVVLIPAYM